MSECWVTFCNLSIRSKANKYLDCGPILYTGQAPAVKLVVTFQLGFPEKYVKIIV
jgi:hypothetical protein